MKYLLIALLVASVTASLIPTSCTAGDFKCLCDQYTNIYAGKDPNVGGLQLPIGQRIESRGGKQVCIVNLARDQSNITELGVHVETPLAVDAMSSFELVRGNAYLMMAYAPLFRNELPYALIESGRQIAISLTRINKTEGGTPLNVFVSHRWIGLQPSVEYISSEMIGDPLDYAVYTKRVLDSAITGPLNATSH